MPVLPEPAPRGGTETGHPSAHDWLHKLFNKVAGGAGRIPVGLDGTDVDFVTPPATEGHVLTGRPGNPSRMGWALSDNIQTFGETGALVVRTGIRRFVLPQPWVIVGVSATVTTPSTSGAVRIDVNRNGTSVYTTQANRPSIAASANNSTETVPDVTAISAGQAITFDIDEAGTGAADLVVALRWRWV